MAIDGETNRLMLICYLAFNRKRLALRKKNMLAKRLESLSLDRTNINSEYEETHTKMQYCLDEGLKALEAEHHEDFSGYSVQADCYKNQLTCIVDKHRDYFDQMDSINAAYELAKEELIKSKSDHLIALKDFSAWWGSQS